MSQGKCCCSPITHPAFHHGYCRQLNRHCDIISQLLEAACIGHELLLICVHVQRLVLYVWFSLRTSPPFDRHRKSAKKCMCILAGQLNVGEVAFEVFQQFPLCSITIARHITVITSEAAVTKLWSAEALVAQSTGVPVGCSRPSDSFVHVASHDSTCGIVSRTRAVKDVRPAEPTCHDMAMLVEVQH